MVLHFFKRIGLIRNTFSNESQPLHNTFPSESNVFAADSDEHFWKSAKDKVILLWKNVNAIILFVSVNTPI